MLVGVCVQGELRGRTFTAPRKSMRGKGRVTVQFGCCYNYAVDREGRPAGQSQHLIRSSKPLLFTCPDAEQC